jgi:glycosyltransferase involved in cell wall biosynthesis
VEADVQLNLISVIIPAYNEEDAIAHTLQGLCNEALLVGSEIIVVDDGSSDHTSDRVAEFPNVQLIRHPVNRGYGSSLLTGMKASSGRYIAWFDADGQHEAADLVHVLHTLIDNNLDYVIGVRDARSHQVRSRTLGKKILYGTILLVARQPVKDFNSGLRAFKREVIVPYYHLFPKGFGASTTTTLLMIERGHIGRDVPIVVKERIGKSSVKQARDGMRTLMIILRVFLLFKPLLFFGTIGSMLILVSTGYGLTEALRHREGFPVLAAVLFILGVQTLFLGLISDQISLLRRERFE